MTKTLSTNHLNDLYLDIYGNVSISSNLIAVKELCEHAAKAQLGEMILAIDQGIPNFRTIWDDAGSTPQFEAVLRKALLQVDSVIEIVNLNIVINGNILEYTATIKTLYGETIVNGGL